MKNDYRTKSGQYESISDLKSLASFVQTKREQEFSRFATMTTKLLDSRVEYTKRFLENALGRKPTLATKAGSTFKDFNKKDSILGDWFNSTGQF